MWALKPRGRASSYCSEDAAGDGGASGSADGEGGGGEESGGEELMRFPG
jgi:hypothetical protein